MERRKKEEAERKAKLDEIAEKQRQRERELEEKERQRREEILGRSAAVAVAPPKTADVSAPPTAVAAAPAPGKFVPRHRRVAAEGGGQAAALPPATDKWSRTEDRSGDRWRDDRRPAAPAAGARTWQSSREQERRR